MARSYVRVYPPTSVKTTNRPLWTQTCFIQRPTLVHGSDSTVHVSVWASYTIDYSRVSGDQTPADLYMAMLTNGAARGRRFAAWALAILAHKNAANKVAIVAAGAVDPLYALARAGGSLKATAVKALKVLRRHALAWALRHRKRRVYPLLLAAGAAIPPDADDAYLRKVAAAGGFPAYEKAHRQALDALAAKAFVRLPTEVAAHVVSFAFHVGYY